MQNKPQNIKRRWSIGSKSLLVLPILSIGTFATVVSLRGCMHHHSRPVGHQDITFDLDAEGRRLVFNAVGNGGRDLFLLNLNNHKVTRLTDSKEYETCPSFSPNGRFLVYSAGRPGDRADHLFMRDMDTNRVQQLTSEDANDCSPTFSPDGSHILFTRDTHYNWGGLAASWSGGGEVWSIKRDGSELKRVLPSSVFALSPHFSPDGKTLLWWNTEGVWTAPADGSTTPQRVIAEGARESVFSPDGKQIAFTRGEYSPDLRVYRMPLAGGSVTQITDTNEGCFYPQFSPTGKTIYYFLESLPEGGYGTPEYSLWRVGIDGKNARQLAGSQLFDAPLSQDDFTPIP